MYRVIELGTSLPVFDLNNYPISNDTLQKQVGIRVHTRLQAALIELILHNDGRKWRDGKPYACEGEAWCNYWGSTLYYFNEGTYGEYDEDEIDLFLETILDYNDFDFSKYIEKYSAELILKFGYNAVQQGKLETSNVVERGAV